MPLSSEAAHSSQSGGSKKHRTSTSSLQSYTRVLSPSSGTPEGGAKFPRIDECAHFHYETVECGRVELTLLDEPPDGTRVNGNSEFGRFHNAFWIKVSCKGKEWVLRRHTPQFKRLDELLHECVYDRRFTQLASLDKIEDYEDSKAQHELLQKYVARLSELPEGQMSCAPVLHWFDMDNKGRNLVAALREIADINIPAVAAAHAVRRYTAQHADELSLEVGDMVSIIDMSDSNWWRGKCLLRVGSFPAQCVRRINDAKQADEVIPAATNLPSSPTSLSPPNHASSPKTKPIMKKHGKFMDFLRSFLVTRPSKSRLKQSGILKERVFGCDLGEYLHNSGDEVPVVVKDCMDFVEKFGIVDGIYRISGVSSHVQKLRHEYDCERRPNLNRDPSGRGEQSICDPHSVAGLCKLYFRELPNPLLTYQLYDRFAQAINAPEDDRLLKIHDVIQQLPPPHYRTLKHLAIHLQFMSRQDEKTSMHCRNLAIVWAPNLLRSRDLEAGLAAFTEARVQSVVTEFLISNADLLFSEKLQNMQYDPSRGQKPPRPKSLMVLSAPKLISLEEAQARCKAGGITQASSNMEDVRPADSDAHDVYRRKSSSPQSVGYKRHNSESSPSPAAVIPLSSGVQSVLNKRRQSMDPKLGSSRPQHNFPSNSRHYASQHSGWRSKIGSFLKKGGASHSIDESGSEKQRRKAPLRRSQSDDSLLSSSHSSRQDIDKLGDTVLQDNEARALHPPRPPMLRQTSSPRSPRPRGRIFLVPEEQLSAGNDSDAGSPRTAVSNSRKSGKSVVPGTPDSLATPSVETLPSSHSPFSGLDSDFPGVMGSTGLGFNPLQYSPTMSSPEPGIPDIPLDKSPAHTAPTESHEGSSLPQPETPVNGVTNILENMKITTVAESEESPKPTKAKTKTLEENKEPQSAINGDGGLTKDGNVANSNVAVPTQNTPPSRQVRNQSSIEQREFNNNNNSKSGSPRTREPPATAGGASPRYTGSPTTATKGSPSPGKVGRSPSGRDKDMQSPGRTALTATQRANLPGSRQSVSPDVILVRDYSIRYTAHQHESNGRMRQSITATFVQDRNRDANVRQPHSIVRSLDVPPTNAEVQKPQKRHSHHHQFARRHHANVLMKSLKQRDDSSDSKRIHYRSLSAGNELDMMKKQARRQRPVPLPRNPSYIASVRPVPLPRRRLYTDEETDSGKVKGHSTKSNFPKGITSAPSTPMDGDFVPMMQYSSNFETAFADNRIPFLDQENDSSERLGGDNGVGKSIGSSDNVFPRKPPLSKSNSASGIITPTDNICASTPPSWV